MKYIQNPNKIYLSIGIFLLFILLGGGIYFLFFSVSPLMSMVSGTEYISGEQGQIIVRISDSKDNPISNAECIVSLLYPDKTFFITDQRMSATSVPGNYYFSFITPELAGIYEEYIRCDIGRKTMFISSSFHVSAGLNLISEIFTTQQTQFKRVIDDILVTQEMLKNNLENITSRVNNMEFQMNRTFEENQAILFDKFSRMGNAMSDIFGSNYSL